MEFYKSGTHATNVSINNKIHPHNMGEPEISVFLNYLAVNRKVSASTQNQALSAVLFLYYHVLKNDINNLDDLIRAKRPLKLPIVFSCDEVHHILM